PAPRAVRIDGDVPDLAADAVAAAEEAVVDDAATADTGPDGHEEHVLAVPTRAVAVLAPGRGVRVVLDEDLVPDAPSDLVGDGEVAPGQVGREPQVAGGAVDEGSTGHPDPGDRIAGGRLEARDELRGRVEDRVGPLLGGGDLLAVGDPAVRRHERSRDLRATDVDADRRCLAHRCITPRSGGPWSSRPRRPRPRSARHGNDTAPPGP